MKKVVLTIFLSVVATFSYAQISIADSTVNVVAYFDIGERYDYKFETNRYRINGADTLLLRSMVRDVAMVVTDSTEISYAIELAFSNYKVTTPDKGSSDNETELYMNTLLSGLKIKYQTDELGAFEKILNQAEINKWIDDLLIFVEEELGEDATEYHKQLQALSSVMKHPFVVQLWVQRFAQQFHYFHGTAYTMGETYSLEYEDQLPTFKQPFKRELEVWLDDIFEEDNDYRICAYDRIDPEQLKDLSHELVASIYPGMIDDEVKDKYRDALTGLDNSIYSMAVIHGWGWVIYSIRSTLISNGEYMLQEDHIIEML